MTSNIYAKYFGYQFFYEMSVRVQHSGYFGRVVQCNTY